MCANQCAIYCDYISYNICADLKYFGACMWVVRHFRHFKFNYYINALAIYDKLKSLYAILPMLLIFDTGSPLFTYAWVTLI